MTITIERFNMFEMAATIATTTTIGTTMATKMIGLGQMFLSKIGNLVIEKMEVICNVMKIRCRR